MTKNEMAVKIINLEWRLVKLEMEHKVCANANGYLSIDQAKKRDYIVRTNYLGKIKDKKIKEDFKIYIEGQCGDKFDSITNKLLNYEFNFENKNILDLFSETLEKFEYKQFVLDTYGNKECK